MADVEWKYGQCFGEKDDDEEFSEADILSAVAFDDSGDYLATGDHGGRIVLFERMQKKKGGVADDDTDMNGGGGGGGGENNNLSSDSTPSAKSTGKYGSHVEYRFFTEFQSHEAEFDYLKSLEIEEKINKIRWCKPAAGSLFLLSTNDKTIKLWKVQEKTRKEVCSWNVQKGNYGAHAPVTSLKIPQLRVADKSVTATSKRIFANGHAYHINSIAVNSDGQTYLSSDDLRINIWSLEDAKCCFNIVDLKPENMEDLTEVITAAELHPSHCNVFMYSTSKGTIKIGDMRKSALCDKHAKVLEEPDDPSFSSYYSDIIASVSDIKFVKGDNYVLSRDYINVKLWDIRKESKPVTSIPVHQHLMSRLCDVYDNQCIYDKFECSMSWDGKHILAGSYANHVFIYDDAGETETALDLSRMASGVSQTYPVGGGPSSLYPSPDSPDFAKRVLHFDWHPEGNIVAIAGLNNLFIYHA